jgi:hypothetical protein
MLRLALLFVHVLSIITFQGNKQYPAEPPAPPEAIVGNIRQTKVSYLVLVGYVIPAFVLLLMIFRPF